MKESKGIVEVLRGGLQTTIQDQGRLGYRKLGIPQSGAMDLHSFSLANKLIDNKENAACLECTLLGPELRFNEKTRIAITGAQCSLYLNGDQVEKDKAIMIEAGDMLEVGNCTRGARIYIAVSGGWKGDEFLASSSTLLTAGFGGFKGRAIQKGDRLTFNVTETLGEPIEISETDRSYFSSNLKIDVFRGPEWDWLTDNDQKELLAQEFEVSSTSDRMGLRLNSELEFILNRSMVSSPVLPGIIQLPPNGKPIILMKDAQTIGGYARILIVKQSLLWRLGQCKPGDKVKFNLIDFNLKNNESTF